MKVQLRTLLSCITYVPANNGEPGGELAEREQQKVRSLLAVRSLSTTGLRHWLIEERS
jgi:hypothetical protein